MKRFFYYFLVVLYSIFAQPAVSAPLLGEDGREAQVLMRDVFAAMPDSILPMVTKNNRLDCIDFIENNMEARVRNKVDEYVTLEALTPDYARCVVTTVQVGEENTSRRLEDSTIRFYHTDWTPLNSTVFSAPSLETYFTALSPGIDAARRSLGSFHPVKLQLSPEDSTLTATLQTAALSADERETVREVVKPVVMQWKGTDSGYSSHF